MALQGVINGYATPLEVKLNNINPENYEDYKIYTDSEPEKNTVTEKLNPEQNTEIAVNSPVTQKFSSKSPESPRKTGPRRPGTPLGTPFIQFNIKGTISEKRGFPTQEIRC